MIPFLNRLSLQLCLHLPQYQSCSSRRISSCPWWSPVVSSRGQPGWDSVGWSVSAPSHSHVQTWPLPQTRHHPHGPGTWTSGTLCSQWHLRPPCSSRSHQSWQACRGKIGNHYVGIFYYSITYHENIPPSAPTGDEQINNIHVSRDVPKSRQLVLPYSLNIHIHPFGIVNPKNHCYLNSVIQLLLPILRTISYDFQFNSSTEGTLSKYMLETAYNAYSSTDVDVLKFQLVQYNQFYDGKNQQDSSECLLMLIEIINKGSVPYYGSHVSNSTGVSLSDILFSFMLEKYIVCNVCGLRSPSIESSGVLYISPTHTSSMQELIMQGLQQKLEKSCFRCNKNTWHVESNHILQPPNYLIIVVNRFRYINNQFAKDKCSIPMDMTVVLGYHKFSLQATIDHHGPSIYSGHYTTSVNCCNRTFYCNDNKITEFDMINTKNSSTAYVVIYKLIT